jgi:hypothetical protein
MAFSTGKYPHCGKTLSSVNIEHIDITEGLQVKWHGASFVCPWCNVVLSVGLDPIAIKADIVSEVVEALRRK